jgi:hypothetical protein
MVKSKAKPSKSSTKSPKYTFADIGPGDRVVVKVPNGLSLKRGKTVQDWAERTGTVNAMLMFHDHVVLNMGGAHGTPQVCDVKNFVRIARKAKSEKRMADVPSWA